MDLEYRMGKPQRRQIIYKALPEEVKLMVDNMTSMGQLIMYPEFLNFVKATAGSSRYSGSKLPQPLTAMVHVQPTPVCFTNPADQSLGDWTHDGWVAWLQTDEAQDDISAGTITDPEGVQALCTLVKGKGKNGGKAAGKSRQSFAGNCWTCNKPRHQSWECPNKPVKGSGKGQSTKGKGKRWNKGKGRSVNKLENSIPAVDDWDDNRASSSLAASMFS